MRFIYLFFLLLPSLALASLPNNTASPSNISHVIYITLDGTRWQDFFASDNFFKNLWKNYKNVAHFYGNPVSPSQRIRVASIPVSLPSYQSQTTGIVQPCLSNGCGRVTVETFLEKFITKLYWNKKDVAVFSSWPTIDFAAQHIPNTIYASTGNMPVYEPDTGLADPVMFELNKRQLANNPGSGDRLDKDTFAQAMHYLDRYQPKFLWISFDDADIAAHNGNLKAYHEALQFYDAALDDLFTYLQDHSLLQNTLIIMTTDHGRGDGDNWTGHGVDLPESKNTWAFVLNGKLIHDPAGKENQFSTLSVRPTIEKVFGL